MTNRKSPLRLFLAFSWLHMLWQTFPFFDSAAPAPQLSLPFFFHLVTWLSYSAIYLLPTASPPPPPAPPPPPPPPPHPRGVNK